MPSPFNPPPFLRLPSVAGEYRPNWTVLTRWAKTISPYACCYNPTAVVPTIPSGAPGADTFIQWTPANNQDNWNFLNQANSTWVRFPYDGLYDIQYRLNFTDAIPAGGIEFQTWLDYATTSDQGFTAPTFTSGKGTTTTREKFASGDSVKTMNATYLNFVGQGNDVFRVGFRVFSTASIAAGSIVAASFRLAMPIPLRDTI